MVPENCLRIPIVAKELENFTARGTFGNQIAHADEPIFRRCIDLVEQIFQLRMATVDIADHYGSGHRDDT